MNYPLIEPILIEIGPLAVRWYTYLDRDWPISRSLVRPHVFARLPNVLPIG